MAIYKQTDTFPARATITLLYGVPGCGKTSLAATADKPILVDCDRGADRAIKRPDVSVASKWDDILADEPMFADYKTVIIDTAKACLDDFLMVYVCERDYKLRTNKLKAYGAIADEFKAFVSRLRSLNVDLVIISHAKEDKDGDTTKFSPDVTGGSKDLLLRMADEVGFITTVNNRRTIHWEPTDRTIGKNVARLPVTQIPDAETPEFDGFLNRIISQVRNSIQSRTEEQRKAIETVERLKTDIEMLETPENADAILAEINTLSALQQAGLKALLKSITKSKGMVYNAEMKKFELCAA
jgi:ATP-dependent Lon protease